jgi:hypothetical protein
MQLKDSSPEAIEKFNNQHQSKYYSKHPDRVSLDNPPEEA